MRLGSGPMMHSPSREDQPDFALCFCTCSRSSNRSLPCDGLDAAVVTVRTLASFLLWRVRRAVEKPVLLAKYKLWKWLLLGRSEKNDRRSRSFLLTRLRLAASRL